MSETTNIGWCHSTGSPWFGCTEKSEGCGHCYARILTETRLARIVRAAYKKAGLADWETRPVWGKTAPRVLTKSFFTDMTAANKRPFICDACGEAFAHKNTPHDAPIYEADGETVVGYHHRYDSNPSYTRRRVFPSLMDWLDECPAGVMDQEGRWLQPGEALARALDTVRRCDQVTWMLCTKRPELWQSSMGTVLSYLAKQTGDSPLGLWLARWIAQAPPTNIIQLTSIENQAHEIRMDEARKIPAVCRGISFEPLLSEIKVRDWTGFQWAIIGGESGCDSRQCSVPAIRSLVSQAQAAGVKVFVKQMGARPIDDGRKDSDHERNL